MNKTILKINLCIAALTATAATGYSQQPKVTPDMDFIQTKSNRLIDYQKDLVDFLTVRKIYTEERESTLELVNIASSIHDHLSSLWNLLYIYNNLSCKSDKAMVGLTAKIVLGNCVEVVDLEIHSVNNHITAIKTPAIVTSGTQLRDDLREIKERLASVKFN